MYFGHKKFFILAVIGSLIIGFSIYLYLNSYFEKITVPVLQIDIKKGNIIKKEDLAEGHFYKQDVPAEVITDKFELIGLEIKTDRYTGDFITKSMIEDSVEDNLITNLKEDESIMSINLDSEEMIAEDLQIGEKIMIVSTEKDKEMNDIFYRNNISSSDDADNNIFNELNIKNYLHNSIFQISENIFIIDGFIYFQNLEIIHIKEIQNDEAGILSDNSNTNSSLYGKCKKREAPYLAKITSGEKYKLLIGPQ